MTYSTSGSLDWRWLGSRLWLAAQVGSVLFMLVCLGIGVKIFLDLRAGRHGLGTPDYAGFYAAATILNEHPARTLYDQDLQDRIRQARVPGTRPNAHYPFGHTPIVAFLLRPLARLPFAWSYAIWLTILAAIAGAGFVACRSFLSWPATHVRGALLLAGAFPPLVFEGWLAGQWCVIGLFWVALALWLVRNDRLFAGGFVLAMCAVKPTLVMFVLPLLLLSGRRRLLAGAIVGGLALAAICLLIVGVDGARAYLDMLTAYSRTMSAGAVSFKTFKHIDLHAFFVRLYGGPGWLPKLSVLAVAAGYVPPLLAAWWLRASRGGDWLLLALCATLTGNMLFSAYTPIYDVSLMIPNVLITGDIVYRHSQEQHNRRLMVAFLVFAGLLVCTAWCTLESARVYGFQPLTVVLLAWGWFQIGLAWWGPSLDKGKDVEQGLRRP